MGEEKDLMANLTSELQELIEDMREGQTLEQIFAKLADPAVFAKKYREDKNYLISPEYYDNYVWVLKIVLICVAAGLFVLKIIPIWNLNFGKEIMERFDDCFKLKVFWENKMVLGLAGIGVTIYKTLRYGRAQR